MDLKTYFRNRDMVGLQEDDLTEDQKNIAVLTIDGNVIGGYTTYSFVRVKEYEKEPSRSQDGKIANLDSYTTFITPKVRIKFNALSIDGYRLLMNLILSKNEFYVGCYDFTAADTNHPNGRWVHQNMYFYPNDYPEIFEYNLDVLAVMGYEIELIGTNTNNENITITLNSNYPSGTSIVDTNGNTISSDVSYVISNAFKNEFATITYPSNFAPSKVVTVDGTEYSFVSWNTEPDATGINYIDENEYAFGGDTQLYAFWSSGTETVCFNYSVNGTDVSTDQDYATETTFTSRNTPLVGSYLAREQLDDTVISYWFDGWYTNSNYTESINGKKPYNLTLVGGKRQAYGKFTAHYTPRT